MAGLSASPSKDVWRDGMCPLSESHQWHFLSLSLFLQTWVLGASDKRHPVSESSVGRWEIIIGRAAFGRFFFCINLFCVAPSEQFALSLGALWTAAAAAFSSLSARSEGPSPSDAFSFIESERG